MTRGTRGTAIALGLVLATAQAGLADNVTPATARIIAMNSTAQDFLQSGSRTSVWYKTQFFANRSYQISVWTVREDGVFVNIDPLELYSDAAGTTLVSAGVTTTDSLFEGSPNDSSQGARTTVFQPTTTGIYLIHTGTDTVALAATKVNVRVRETTLFSPWTSRAAGFEGFMEIHNNTSAPVNVTLRAFNNLGVLQGSALTFAVPANATEFKTATQVGVPVGTFAGLVLTHDGAYGAISGNITTLNGANGLSFDSAFTPREFAAGGGGGDESASSGANSDITSLTGLTTPLSVGQGGTGQSTLASNGIIYGQGTSAVATTVGAAGQVLSGTAGAPAWTASPSLTSPSLNGNLTLVTPSTSTTGNIMKGANRFIHNFGTSNTFVGVNAGNFTMTGDTNTATGVNALLSNTNGIFNTASGVNALRLNTTGFNNTAAGVNALENNTAGSRNTADGLSALTANTTAGKNTAVGVEALRTQSFSNAGAAWDSLNTAVGYQALFSNQPTTNANGLNNTAIGGNALQGNTIGAGNIGVGASAGINLTTGSFNIAIGNVGVAAEANTIRIGTAANHTRAFVSGIRGVTTGVADALAVVIDSAGQLGTAPAATPANFSGNLAGEVSGTQGATVVSNAVATNTASAIVRRDGSGDFAAGSTALSGNLSLVAASTSTTGNIMKGATRFVHNFGFGNIFVGLGAGNFTMTGSSNTALGSGAFDADTTGADNTAVGTSALGSNTTGNANTATGSFSLTANATGNNNTGHGAGALSNNTTGANNTATGAFALIANTTGSNNAASGASALNANTTANKNTAVGADALRTQSFTNGGTAWDSLNTAVGYQALFSNQPTSVGNGDSNTAIGANALRSNTVGAGNTAGGASALRNNTDGGANSAFGVAALTSNTNGDLNTAMGLAALQLNTIGSGNTGSGWNALAANTSGSNNTAIGVQALDGNTTGSDNTAVGVGADVATGALTNATAIGSNAVVNASNKIRLGNSSVTVVEGQVAYTFPSDRTRKENFRDVNAQAVLQKLREMDVTTWNYIGHDPKEFRHYGPMAQDFYAAFGRDEVGAIGTETTINSGDITAVLMIGLKALDAQVQKDQRKIEAQTARIAELERQNGEIAALRQQVANVTALLKDLEPKLVASASAAHRGSDSLAR